MPIPNWLVGEAIFPGNNQGDKSERVKNTTKNCADKILTDHCVYALASMYTLKTGKKLDLKHLSPDDIKSKYLIKISVRNQMLNT